MCARSGSLSRLSAHRSRSHGRRCAPYRPRNASVSIASGVRCSPTARRIAGDRRRIRRVPAVGEDRARDRRRPHRLRHRGARRGRAARPAAGRRGHARRSRGSTATGRRTSRSSSPKMVGAPPRDDRGSGSSTRSRRRRRRHVERVEIAGPGLRQLLPRADVVARRPDRRGRRRATLRARRRVPRRAHQPRVRLREPDRSAARGRRTVGRGRRRDREPARGAGRGGAPRVLPERRRGAARHVRRVAAWRATTATPLPEDGYQGAVPRRDGRARCGPSSATT